MSKLIYVSDDITVICLQGLRMATKSDSTFHHEEDYYLQLEYKGLSRSVAYGKDKAMRDKTYSAIAKLLTQEEKGEVKDG